MKHLLTVIIGSVIAIAIFMLLDWKDSDLSFHPDAGIIHDNQPESDTGSDDQSELEECIPVRIDTVMNAKVHSFGYKGDVTMWGGWYLDTTFVGDDPILAYDSVGPSLLKLSLVTREIIVDLDDEDAVTMIRRFLNPIAGFSRFRQYYVECLDSIYYEGYGYDGYMGGFTFEVDYPDSCNQYAGKINRFICELTRISESEKAKVPGLAAFYAGFKQINNYRRVYSGNPDDIQSLSDFLAHRTFENWRRVGDFGMGYNDATLTIRPHITNDRYVTFSKYEYVHEGMGHGMYTETFHTFDLKSGKKLKNRNIFKSQSLDKVILKLYEIMAQDPHYLEWHGGSLEVTDVEAMIESWQSHLFYHESEEQEDSKTKFKFELPDGALTSTGVLFSFQPYEIDCWAAGSYHFIVPYTMLAPYMTTDVKKLIKTDITK